MNRIVTEVAPYSIEVLIGGDRQAKQHLLSDLKDIVHATFAQDPEFDRVTLGCYLDCDYVMVVRLAGKSVGFHIARPRIVDGRRLLHLSGAFLLPHCRGNRLVLGHIVDANLCLAAQQFGTEDYWVAVRTNQPKVVGSFMESPHFVLYPRPGAEHGQDGEAVTAFAGACYAGQKFDAERAVFPGIFPEDSVKRKQYWHHNEEVNRFFQSRVDYRSGDALFLVGRTKPPLPDTMLGGETCSD